MCEVSVGSKVITEERRLPVIVIKNTCTSTIQVGQGVRNESLQKKAPIVDVSYKDIYVYITIEGEDSDFPIGDSILIFDDNGTIICENNIIIYISPTFASADIINVNYIDTQVYITINNISGVFFNNEYIDITNVSPPCNTRARAKDIGADESQLMSLPVIFIQAPA